MDIKKVRLRHDEFKTNQKRRFLDEMLVDKLLDCSNGWLEHKYLKDNIKRKKTTLMGFINKMEKKKGVTIDEDISEYDFDTIVTQIVLGHIDLNKMQTLSKKMLETTVVKLEEQIKIQSKEAENLKYKSIVYLRKLDNIIEPDVPVSNMLKNNLIRRQEPISRELEEQTKTKSVDMDIIIKKYTCNIMNNSSLNEQEQTDYKAKNKINIILILPPYAGKIRKITQNGIDYLERQFVEWTPQYIQIPSLISNINAVQLCNIDKLNERYVKIKHFDIGLLFNLSYNILITFAKRKFETTELYYSVADTYQIDKQYEIKYSTSRSNLLEEENRTTLTTTAENQHKVFNMKHQLSFVVFTDLRSARETFDIICDKLENFYAEFGFKWNSEIVVSGGMDTASAKECVIIGTTPVNQRKIELARIRYTSNYYSHKLKMIGKDEYDAHIICVDMLNDKAIFPFVVEMD
jgi:hypothetical protein